LERRLAAILAADVVGYSRLIEADEAGTLAAMKAQRRELWTPKIEEHGGRVVGTAGDSILVEFASAVAAVECAVGVQQGMAALNAGVPDDRRMLLRVGINIGEVVVDGDDIHGDGVNVAARLETLCEPGGVALSGSVHEQVQGKLEAHFEDAGEHEVKNITRPIRVWRWSETATLELLTTPETAEPLPLPDKPSIAVLPFDNMSDDPGQEFFADGIAEDVITALSRFRSLFVIARNSSFSYKGAAVDITQVARELGVRYVVEGSVRKAGNRVRITAQLIDATSGNHLWADRFDGSLDDVFDLQDQITEQIVVAVEPEIGARERERARRKPPENLDAWELLQRGLSHFHHINKADHAEAMRLFREAIALDPEFAAAHAYLAFALSTSVLYGYVEDTAKAVASARAVAEQAVSLDPNEPMARFALGRVHSLAGEIAMAIGETQTAIAINPNFAWGHFGLGFAYHYGAGQAEQSLPHYDAALRLSPRDPRRWLHLMMKGSALRALGRHDEAIAHCRQACQIPDSGFLSYVHLAAASAEAGQKHEAQAAVEKATQLEPALSIDFMRNNFVGMHETTLKSLLDSLRKAGVPE
jgi:adenylate cyclase